MLRPVAEPPDRPYEVALIRDPGHRRDEQLVGENNARGGQHRHIQFAAVGHVSGSSIAGKVASTGISLAISRRD